MASNKERRVWRTISVSADPFNRSHLYMVQELRGVYYDLDNGEEEWEDAEKPAPTRVVYTQMNSQGSLKSSLPPV